MRIVVRLNNEEHGYTHCRAVGDMYYDVEMTQLVRVVADPQAIAGSENVHKAALKVVLAVHRVELKLELVVQREPNTPGVQVADMVGPRG